jgi:phospho-acceptor domain-containing protein/HAMP domain-containing protein/calcineurin-like phosphoesterase family protein
MGNTSVSLLPGRNCGWAPDDRAWSVTACDSISLGNIVEAANRVADGDFSTRLPEYGPPAIRSVGRAFNSMAARLETQDRQRRNLMAEVAHELRTPLSVIQGRLEGLLDGVYAKDDAQISEVLDETRILSRLVDDLRTLADTESGMFSLQKESTDIGTLWPIFFGIEKDLLRQTSFFPSLGNHERNTHYFQDIFHGATPYYSFDWGNGHFIVIDSDIQNVAPTEYERNVFWKEQTRWLENDLQSHQRSGYRFVIAHHPPFTAVASRQGDNPHMTALVPMLEKYHVSAAFFGHAHNYQHYLKGGIHYVITGGGGAPLYDVSKPPEEITQKAVSIENFVTVSVDGDVAHIQAIDINGHTLEEFESRTISKLVNSTPEQR